MIPKFLLDSDDDWMEGFRRTWYPRLHPYLQKVGGYSVGLTPENQYAGTVGIDEETLEGVLVDLGFRRNPIACYKHDENGRNSEGSWVLLARDDPSGKLLSGRQLHVTMYVNLDGTVDLYAHNEIDWRVDWRGHLDSENFRPKLGVRQLRRLLNNRTYLSL